MIVTKHELTPYLYPTIHNCLTSYSNQGRFLVIYKISESRVPFIEILLKFRSLNSKFKACTFPLGKRFCSVCEEGNFPYSYRNSHIQSNLYSILLYINKLNYVMAYECGLFSMTGFLQKNAVNFLFFNI